MVEPLTEAPLEWADAVFISAMIIQKKSVQEVIARCRKKGLTVVAGGPVKGGVKMYQWGGVKVYRFCS